jgi:hypothetical protein
LDHLLKNFEQGGMLIQTDADPPTYVPARPLETTTVKQVLDLVRSADEGFLLNTTPLTDVGEVGKVITQIDRAVEEALGGKTIKELVMLEPESIVSSIEHYQQQANQDVLESDR